VAAIDGPAVDSGWDRMRAPLLTVGGLAATTLALHLRDPHQLGTWGICPSAALGIYCPGCGGLRAVNDLTNGDVAAALSSNLLVTALLPFASVALAWWAVNRARGVRRAPSQQTVLRLTATFTVVAFVFAVARNTPWGGWLAP
jgi:hypothetical protein